MLKRIGMAVCLVLTLASANLSFSSPHTTQAATQEHPLDAAPNQIVKNSSELSCGFPTSPLLDDFNKANGGLKSDWDGHYGTAVIGNNLFGLGVFNNHMQISWDGFPTGQLAHWTKTLFGRTQEVYYTIDHMNPPHAKTVGLKMKANYSEGGPVVSGDSLIVAYDVPSQIVSVYVDNPFYANRVITFSAQLNPGDQFGARAREDGYAEVFRNAEQIGTADVRYWVDYDRTGFIGVYLNLVGQANPAIPEMPIGLDDFGGGFSLCGYPSPRVNVTGIEVTQGIQNLDNDVPMVEGRQTVVRVYIKAQDAGRQNELVSFNEFVLWMYDADTGLPIGPPLLPANTGLITLGLADFPRFNLEGSPYFIIPNEYAKGKIKFFVSMNLPYLKNCREQDASPNDCTQQVEFSAVPDLEVRLISVVWVDRGIIFNTEHRPTRADLEGVAEEIKAIFPVSSVNWDVLNNEYVYEGSEQPRTASDFALINRKVFSLRKSAGCDTNCKTFYYGVLVDPLSQGGTAGLMSDGVASGYYIPYLFYPIASHELGHLAGQLHSPCGVSESIDPNFPFQHGRIEDILKPDKYTRGYFGLDMRTMRILHPDIGDLMGYCFPTWPSAYTYNGLRNFLTARAQDNQDSQHNKLNKPQTAMTQTVMFVGGMTPSTHSKATLDSIRIISSAISISAPSSGLYTIRMENKNGQVLYQHEFTPGDYGSFVLVLPWQPAIAKVSLMQGSTTLATRIASAHTPAVRITSPANATTLTWEASDADGDRLTYEVQYSQDNGKTWETIALNVPRTQYDLKNPYLRGGAQAIFRVLATDGFHTAQAQSDVIALANRVPSVNVQPVKAEYASGEWLKLNGSAYDPEDGLLTGTNITWTSSQNGFLGNEIPLWINTNTLATGTHIFTLTATDRDGQTSAVSVTTRISTTPFSTIAILYTVPESVSLMVPLEVQTRTTRMVAIGSASGLPISFTASSTQSWIKLNKTKGRTPDVLIVEMDASGFKYGMRQGSIGIQMEQNTGVTATIDIKLLGQLPRVYLPILRR